MSDITNLAKCLRAIEKIADNLSTTEFADLSDEFDKIAKFTAAALKHLNAIQQAYLED